MKYAAKLHLLDQNTHFFTFVKNSSYTFMGTLIPMLLGLATTPILLTQLGPARFALYILAWTVIGYTSLFDLGMGRSTTLAIASRLRRSTKQDVQNIIKISTLTTAAYGILGGGALFLAAPYYLKTITSLNHSLQNEATYSILIIAASSPLLATTVAIKGALEAFQSFKEVALVKTTTGILLFLLPLASLLIGPALQLLTCALILARLIGAAQSAYFCHRALSKLPHNRLTTLIPAGRQFKELLTVGTAVSISQAIGPILGNVEKFILPLHITLYSAAMYAIPADILPRLLIIPSTLVTVLFPAISTLNESSPHEATMLYKRASMLTGYIVYPLALILLLFSKELLNIWVGDAVSKAATSVSAIITIGVFINSFGYIHLTYLQATAKPWRVASIHLVELAAYVPLLYIVVKNFGLIGAALSYATRIAIDTLLLWYVAAPHGRPRLPNHLTAFTFATMLIGLFAVITDRPFYFRASILLLTIAGALFFLKSSIKTFILLGRNAIR